MRLRGCDPGGIPGDRRLRGTYRLGIMGSARHLSIALRRLWHACGWPWTAKPVGCVQAVRRLGSREERSRRETPVVPPHFPWIRVLLRRRCRADMGHATARLRYDPRGAPRLGATRSDPDHGHANDATDDRGAVCGDGIGSAGCRARTADSWPRRGARRDPRGVGREPAQLRPRPAALDPRVRAPARPLAFAG